MWCDCDRDYVSRDMGGCKSGAGGFSGNGSNGDGGCDDGSSA